ncbi:MAG: helix-turn-helix domain-containing protein [Microbacteriaceae bacterium]
MSATIAAPPRPPAHPGRPVRRSFDAMIVDRLVPGEWRYPEPSGDDYLEWPYLVTYAEHGSIEVEIDGAVSRLGTGQVALVCNRARLIMRCTAESSAILLCLPRSTVEPYRQTFAAAAEHVWNTEFGGSTASIIGHILRGLHAQMDAFAPRTPGRFAQHLVGFLAVMCAETSVRRPAAGRPDDVLEKAKRHIEEHLGQADLTPETIAADLFVSTRTLHRVFENDGYTVAGWVRHRRLENCRLDLEDAAHDGIGVSQIGTKWGLWDAAHFSRLFKAAYGLPPRRYRAVRGGPLPAAAASVPVDVRVTA